LDPLGPPKLFKGFISLKKFHKKNIKKWKKVEESLYTNAMLLFKVMAT